MRLPYLYVLHFFQILAIVRYHILGQIALIKLHINNGVVCCYFLKNKLMHKLEEDVWLVMF